MYPNSFVLETSFDKNTIYQGRGKGIRKIVKITDGGGLSISKLQRTKMLVKIIKQKQRGKSSEY